MRGHSGLHLSDPLFKMPIFSRMWDRDGILTKQVAIDADVNIRLPWGDGNSLNSELLIMTMQE